MLLRPFFQISCNFDPPPQKGVPLLVPFFNLGVILKVFFWKNYEVFKAMVAKGGNFDLEKKRCYI
jgi:hypothetical protein